MLPLIAAVFAGMVAVSAAPTLIGARCTDSALQTHERVPVRFDLLFLSYTPDVLHMWRQITNPLEHADLKTGSSAPETHRKFRT